jgi:hypothetical protein
VGEFAAVTELDHKPLENAGEVLHDLIVPKANDAPAMGFQPGGAPCVLCFSPTMLPTIDFNDERLLDAGEIDDVGTERHLTTEAVTKELPFPNMLP